jgi:hypothetical protein
LHEATPSESTYRPTWTRSGTNQWRLVSLPVFPASSDEAAVLGIAASTLKLARYRPTLTGGPLRVPLPFGVNSNRHELYPNLYEPLAPGRAYWLKLPLPSFSPTIRGGAPTTARPYEVPLRGGWNMVGVPFPSKVFALSAVKVRSGNTTLDWHTAVARRWVAPGVWSWKPSGGYTRVDANSPAGQVLRPWEGYYLYTTVGRGVSLVFDPSRTVGGSIPAATPVSNSNWQVSLSVVAPSGRQDGLRFGVVPLVNNQPAAGQPPLGARAPTLTFTRTAFPATATTGNESGWADAWVKPFTSASGVWEFVVDGYQAGETVYVEWGDLSRVPQMLNWQLIDVALNKKTAMPRTSLNRRYSFVAGNAPRTFRILGTPQSASLTTRSLAGSPGVQIEWQAEFSTVVELQIETSGGEVVREIGLPREARAGEKVTWHWDGRDNAGQMLAPGAYVARVRSQDAGGDSQETRMKVTLTLPTKTAS